MSQGYAHACMAGWPLSSALVSDIHPAAILYYATVNKVITLIGHQFYNKCLCLSCFQIQVIIPNIFIVEDNFPIA